MAEDTLYNAMLLDFYGPLLTEKQREYFDLHYNSDYSLTEIAEDSGVSRQAVWDNITRARRCGLTAAHSRCAAVASSTARSSSADEASGTRACTLPVFGSNTSP